MTLGRRRFLQAAASMAASTVVRPARAQDAPRTLRLATLTPRNRTGLRLMQAWNRTLEERTDGRVQIQVYWGGVQGDPRTMVRRLRIGQLDLASLPSSGLGLLHRPSLVLQAPGLLRTYPQLDRVRAALAPTLEAGFLEGGHRLVSWGDAGRLRLFSRAPLLRPGDLRARRPWLPASDPLFGAWLEVVGAAGVRLSVGEVQGALRTGMIDVVPGSALAVVGLQWHTTLSHYTAQSDGFLQGALVAREASLQALRARDREAFLESATEHQTEIRAGVREADERAHRALAERLTAVTARDEARWDEVARLARRRAAGRVYPVTLLERAESLAAA